jgi:hypothetical protein
MTQKIACLPSKCKALGSIPSTVKKKKKKKKKKNIYSSNQFISTCCSLQASKTMKTPQAT